MSPTRTALLLLIAGFGAPVSAACPEDPEAQLAISLRKAIGSFQAMDVDGFTAHRLEARRSIACLGEVIAREDAAAYHRIEALDAFLARDEEAAFHHFRAALYAHWEYDLPESLAPRGNPIRQAWTDAASYPLPEYPEDDLPRRATLYLDGQEQPGRPDEIAAVVQLVHKNGTVLYSGYLAADAPAPDWKKARSNGPVAAAAPAPAPTAQRSASGTPSMKVKTGGRAPRVREPIQVNVPLLAGGTAALLAGGGLYLAAAASRAAFEDQGTAFEDLEGLQTQTNSLVIASGVSAGVGVGLGAASFVVAW